MKKNLLFIGAFAVAGFFGLTAFGGQTKAQQEAEIAKTIQDKLDGLRTELQAQCEQRIAAEAQNQYAAWVAEQAAKPAPTPEKKGIAKTPTKTTKRKGTTTTKVAPLPQPTPPQPTPPQPTGPAMPGAQKKESTPGSGPNMPGAQKKETTPAPSDGSKPGPKMPGATKKEEGGGN